MSETVDLNIVFGLVHNPEPWKAKHLMMEVTPPLDEEQCAEIVATRRTGQIGITGAVTSQESTTFLTDIKANEEYWFSDAVDLSQRVLTSSGFKSALLTRRGDRYTRLRNASAGAHLVTEDSVREIFRDSY